jgi:hypothetical protein
VTAAAPYERLAELAERELTLVSAFELSRIGELVALAQERTTLVASLPAQPPAAARAALVRAAECQQRTTALLARICHDVGRELGDVDHARRAARGYAVAAPARPLLDRAG